jgi:ankyrin repeat protein
MFSFFKKKPKHPTPP